jgi:hypothetical protein
MSESFPQHIERLEHEPTLPSPERHLSLPEHAEAEHGEADTAKAIAEARQHVAEIESKIPQASPLERLQGAENTSPAPSPRHINQELKYITLNRELKQIQRKLSSPARSFSHFIHKPTVRTVSEAAGKTVSRPSGLLGGGLVALVGTTGYLYLAKHIGFNYNYSVFLLLFAGGFVFGLALELAVYTATASRRAAD